MMPTAPPLAATPLRARRRGTGVMIAAAICLAVGSASSIFASVARRADRSSVLVIVEDSFGGERRADALVLLTWWQRCDALGVTSIPRDLMLTAGGEVASVVYETDGAARLTDDVGALLDVRVGAVVTFDLDGAADIARSVGAIELDFEHDSLDRRTGFRAGPGPVDLDGDDAIAFLRSRTWQEHVDGVWTMATTSDLDRIARMHDFARAALHNVRAAGPGQLARIGESSVRSAHVDVVDPYALTGFVAGARVVSGGTVDALDVVEERARDERRSPFAPHDLGATHRLVLADGAALSSPCDEVGV